MRANYNARLCASMRKAAGARTMENQWKNQCAEQSEQSDIRAPACGCNANTNARPPLPAPGRAKFFDWRMFLSANRRPLRRNMRSQKSETRISAIADFARECKQAKKALPLS